MLFSSDDVEARLGPSPPVGPGRSIPPRDGVATILRLSGTRSVERMDDRAVARWRMVHADHAHLDTVVRKTVMGWLRTEWALR